MYSQHSERRRVAEGALLDDSDAVPLQHPGHTHNIYISNRKSIKVVNLWRSEEGGGGCRGVGGWLRISSRISEIHSPRTPLTNINITILISSRIDNAPHHSVISHV